MIRVLIVDDCPVMCELLQAVLTRDAAIEVVGIAHDPYQARELIAQRRPHLLTLDIQMPRMDGVTFLGKLMQHHPLPVIVLSSHTGHGSDLALQALRSGAGEVFAKPSSAADLGSLERVLIAAVRSLALRHASEALTASVQQQRIEGCLDPALLEHSVIAIGASTGGPKAIEAILAALPAAMPPIGIVQHMPASFLPAFAARLDQISALQVRLAEDGMELRPGMVVVANGETHMELRAVAGGRRWKVACIDAPPVGLHRPAVDVLFSSFAACAARRSIAVLLTGMGRDGADGMQRLHEGGAYCIAQDEASSVVFGMPRQAIEAGCIDHVVALPDMARHLFAACQRVAVP